jgi:hypothetical protein
LPRCQTATSFASTYCEEIPLAVDTSARAVIWLTDCAVITLANRRRHGTAFRGDSFTTKRLEAARKQFSVNVTLKRGEVGTSFSELS